MENIKDSNRGRQQKVEEPSVLMDQKNQCGNALPSKSNNRFTAIPIQMSAIVKETEKANSEFLWTAKAILNKKNAAGVIAHT